HPRAPPADEARRRASSRDPARRGLQASGAVVKRLAVSIGCPSGIGPEVSVVAAASSRDQVLLVGDRGVLARAAKLRGVDPRRLVRVASAAEAWALPPRKIGVLEAPRVKSARPGRPTKEGGAAQLAWIDAATDLVVRK